jgi:hypothetical protein
MGRSVALGTGVRKVHGFGPWVREMVHVLVDRITENGENHRRRKIALGRKYIGGTQGYGNPGDR